MQVCPPRRFAAFARGLVLFILAELALTSIGGGSGHIGWTETAAAAAPIETMERISRDLGLQIEMPKDETPKEKEIQFSQTHLHIPGEIAWLILGGALIVGLAFVIFALRDTFPSFSRRSRAKPDAAVVLPINESIERMAETGDDADELAKRGRLAEAMHMLLLRSLTELRKRLGVTIADSLTSREILQRLVLPELGRNALADLIQRVEFVHFGSRIAVLDDYRACRASYEALIDAMRAPTRHPSVAAA